MVWQLDILNFQGFPHQIFHLYVYTMKYYSAIKRSKIMPFAETWIDLETVIQSEVSQKDKYHIFTHICGI